VTTYVSTVNQDGEHTGFARKKNFDQILEAFEGDIGLEFTFDYDEANITDLQWDNLKAKAAQVYEEWIAGRTKKVLYVSGHLDLTRDEFNAHYVPKLDAAVKEPPVAFVMGDARGADQLAQAYLGSKYANVTVYHMFEKPRYNAGFDTVGGFTSDTSRDEAMTQASTHDIAWVRPGREASGTAKNLARRGST